MYNIDSLSKIKILKRLDVPCVGHCFGWATGLKGSIQYKYIKFESNQRILKMVIYIYT